MSRWAGIFDSVSVIPDMTFGSFRLSNMFEIPLIQDKYDEGMNLRSIPTVVVWMVASWSTAGSSVPGDSWPSHMGCFKYAAQAPGEIPVPRTMIRFHVGGADRLSGVDRDGWVVSACPGS